MHGVYGNFSHLVQRIPEVCQDGANVEYNLLLSQAAVQGMCDVVECCDILMCLFCCAHYYIDVLPVHLGGISGDIQNRDDVD